MSWEAWGDDNADEYDHLLEAGWWPGEQTKEVVAAINALVAEPVYEGGKMQNGISTRFLMRLTLLRYEAGLVDGSDPLVREAKAALFPSKAD